MNSGRRSFLKLSSSTMAACCLPNSRLQAAPSEQEIRIARPIGFRLYGMKSLPVLDAIDQGARIGYDNVEVCIMDDFPTEIGRFTSTSQHQVGDRAREHNLQISSLLFHGSVLGNDQKHQEDLETIKRAGEISRVLDESNPPLLESVMGGRKEDWEPKKNMMVDRVGAWADAAGNAGVKVAVKAHAGNAVFA